jgi:hypothetical protein
MRRFTTWHTVVLLATAAIAAAAPARAAERARIAVYGVRGDGGGAIAGQLTRGLCGTFDCAQSDEVRRGGKLDFDAVREAGVDGVLFGTATRTGKSPRVAVALLTTSLTPARIWALPLDAHGNLAASTLSRFSGELRAELASRATPRGGRAPAVAEREPEPAPAAAPTPPPRSAASSRPSRRAPVAATPVASARESRGGRIAALDVGFDLVQRKLSYSGAGAGGAQLLDYSASAIVSPMVRLEVAPVARSSEDWTRGLTIFGAYGHSVGLETEAPGGATHGTTYTRLEVGAGLRFWPIEASRASLLAGLSWQMVQVKVSPAGSIPGLPDADLSGPRAGLSLEAPFGARYALLAGAGFTYWTSAKQLVKTYFPSGSAWGVDAGAGLSVAVTGPFSVRALLQYARTSYKVSGASAYVATGATESYLGGQVLGRVEF